MTLGGDPAAVSAGAARLAGLAESYTSGGEDVRAAGGRLGAAWRGDAGPVATQAVTRAGAAVDVGAEVVRAAGPILEQYAQALREAQQAYVTARAALESADDAVRAAQNRPQPLMPAEEGFLQQGVDGALAGMDAAREKERQANRAAATGIDGLTARLSGMTVPEDISPGEVVTGLQSLPGTAVAQRTPAPGPVPGPETVVDHPGTLLHPALTALSLPPVLGAPFALGDAGIYAAEGRPGEASLAALGAVPVAGPLGRLARGGELLRDARATEEATAAGRGVEGATGGTAWFRVTDDAGPRWPGTNVPRSFDLHVGGESYRVHPNATKHMAELQRGRIKDGRWPHQYPAAEMAAYVEKAQAHGLRHGRNEYDIDGFELGIDTKDGVIFHYRGRR
jgi:uncharacterized protein YukE